MRPNDGGTAFPFTEHDQGDGSIYSESPGISARDYFAAKAMAAMIGTAAAPCLGGLDRAEDLCANAAYKMADAMLRAREAKS